MARCPLGFVAGACCVLLVSLCGEGPLAAQGKPPLDLLTSRLSAYLANYETQLASVVAHEHYEQEYRSTSLGRRLSSDRRQLDSEFLFLRLPTSDDWVGFRDVVTVDNVPLKDESPRLVERIAPGTEAAFAEARRISEANARFNIGDIPRTINVPTATLTFLGERYRARIRFQRPVADRAQGQSAWRLDFTETGKPTRIQTREGADQRARGSVWLATETGAVLRTSLRLGDDDRAEDYVRSSINVNYGVVAALDFLVPIDMYESYYRPSRDDGYSYSISAHAIYSDFRRFSVGGRVLP